MSDEADDLNRVANIYGQYIVCAVRSDGQPDFDDAVEIYQYEEDAMREARNYNKLVVVAKIVAVKSANGGWLT